MGNQAKGGRNANPRPPKQGRAPGTPAEVRCDAGSALQSGGPLHPAPPLLTHGYSARRIGLFDVLTRPEDVGLAFPRTRCRLKCLHPGSPRSARGSTRPPPLRSSPRRAIPARPAGGNAPGPAAHRSCSATGPCGPSPPAGAGSGSAGSLVCSIGCSVIALLLQVLLARDEDLRPRLDRGGSRAPPESPSYSAMYFRTRSAVLSDGERPRSIWRIRFGSPNTFMPKVVGLRPVR